MASIQDIVKQALITGYLSLRAERRLRHLVQGGEYGREALCAFTRLQVATMEGRVTQQSRQQLEQGYQAA